MLSTKKKIRLFSTLNNNDNNKINKRILRYSSHACVFHIPLLVYLFVSQNKSLNTTEYCDTRTHACVFHILLHIDIS